MLKGEVFFEINENNGEDAPPIVSDKLIAVMDGLGGAGAYPIANTGKSSKTNAYIGSRLCRTAIAQLCTKEYIEHLFESLHLAADAEHEQIILAQAANEIGCGIRDVMCKWLNLNAPNMRACIPSGFRVLPTTLACFMFMETEERVDAIAVWAGDSRCYVLTGNGLKQVSHDELKGGPDYQELLHQDCEMTNQINMTQPYTLSVRLCSFQKPCAFLTATDGCFMYIPSPRPSALRFEYTLLRLLLNSVTMDEAMNKIQVYLQQNSQDDCSLAFAAYGINDYEGLKNMLVKRGELFMSLYGSAWKNIGSLDTIQVEYDALKDSLITMRNAYRSELATGIKEMLMSENAAIMDCPALLTAASHWEDSRNYMAGKRQELGSAVKKAQNTAAELLVDHWKEVIPIQESQNNEDGQEHTKAYIEHDIRRNVEFLSKLNRRVKKQQGRFDGVYSKIKKEYLQIHESLHQIGYVMDSAPSGDNPEANKGMQVFDKLVIQFDWRYTLFRHQYARLQRAAQRYAAAKETLKNLLEDKPIDMVCKACCNEEYRRHLITRIPHLETAFSACLNADHILCSAVEEMQKNAETVRLEIIDSFCTKPDLLVDWLEDKHYCYGDKSREYLDKLRYYKQMEEQLSLFERQWISYKPLYEELLALPIATSIAVSVS